ncbi:MAG TPA: MaoC family dehydratase [Solirubrobacterales bacterium]|nr:MaoC family dehydratase [Solirubrobacterales bacterium]
MEPVQVDGIDQLKELIGQELGPSDWLEITQQDIDRFADVSRDHQWIHVDPERAAKESPYGATVAHGNLTLSLVDSFRPQLIQNRGVKMGINYGFNKVRFPAAVPAGTRVRARAEVLTVDDLGDGWWQVVTKYTIDGEQSEKPVCVAESVGRALVG